VAARESNHFGAAAYWGQKISAAGMIGIVMCNASPIVAPWQAKESRLGTNPICMSVPGPWLLDMATTTVASNRIFKALLNGEETIPAGWAVDSEGVPTTDTDAAIRGMPMPLGGYKGSGLAMMVEILCGVLSGGAMSVDVGGIRIQGKPTRVSQTFVAMDAGRFMPVAEFHRRVEWLVNTVKSAAPAKGYHEVMVAGDPEWRAEAERREGDRPRSYLWHQRSAVELASADGNAQVLPVHLADGWLAHSRAAGDAVRYNPDPGRAGLLREGCAGPGWRRQSGFLLLHATRRLGLVWRRECRGRWLGRQGLYRHGAGGLHLPRSVVHRFVGFVLQQRQHRSRDRSDYGVAVCPAAGRGALSGRDITAVPRNSKDARTV